MIKPQEYQHIPVINLSGIIATGWEKISELSVFIIIPLSPRILLRGRSI